MSGSNDNKLIKNNPRILHINPVAPMASDYVEYDLTKPLGVVHDLFQRRMEPGNFNLRYFRILMAGLEPFVPDDPQATYELAFATLQAAPHNNEVAKASKLLDGITGPAFGCARSIDRLRNICTIMSENAHRKVADFRLTRVNWSIYNKCPMVCSGCYNPFVSGQFTFGECLSVLKALSQSGVESIMISGGDPLLWPPLLKFAKHASDYGVRLGIDSTGVSLTPELLKKLAPFIDTFAFRLDALNIETIRSFRHAPQRDLLSDAMRVFRMCKDEGVRHLRVHTVVTKETIHGLDEVAKWVARQSHIDQWILFQWWGRRASQRDIEKYSVTDDEFRALFGRLSPGLPSVELLLSSVSVRPMSNFFIRSDGVVVTFGRQINEEFMLGDLRTQSPSELLQSPAVDVASLLPTLLN